MASVRLALMQKREIGEAARVLSVAMLDNPLHVAVLLGNGEAQRMEIETMFSGMLHGAPEIVLTAWDVDRMVGVMRMKSCLGGDPAQAAEPAGDENDVAWRKRVWHSEWDRRDPPREHWHLGPVGVLPSHQGQGVGSLLMARFCQEVDACGAEAYLETDLEKNVRFYEKFGFELIKEADILGVRNRYMLRPARR